MSLILLALMSFSIILATIFYPYDKAAVVYFNKLRTPIWDMIFMTITNSAGIIAYGTLTILLIASFFIKKPQIKWKFYGIVLAGIISGFMVITMKIIVQRVRPFHLLPVIHPLGPSGGWSFPSGHTSDAFFLAAILGLVYPNRRLLIAVSYFWAVLVGCSRVYLGVHYPSDVLAAITLSSACSVVAFKTSIAWRSGRRGTKA